MDCSSIKVIMAEFFIPRNDFWLVCVLFGSVLPRFLASDLSYVLRHLVLRSEDVSRRFPLSITPSRPWQPQQPQGCRSRPRGTVFLPLGSCSQLPALQQLRDSLRKEQGRRLFPVRATLRSVSSMPPLLRPQDSPASSGEQRPRRPRDVLPLGCPSI